jgi:hypothetical protein
VQLRRLEHERDDQRHQHGLDTTVQGVQTAITIFPLVMAALMIPGGKLTDRWGRKRCFTLGLIVYWIGALLSAVSPGLGVLIFGNWILEGVGTAVLIPRSSSRPSVHSAHSCRSVTDLVREVRTNALFPYRQSLCLGHRGGDKVRITVSPDGRSRRAAGSSPRRLSGSWRGWFWSPLQAFTSPDERACDRRARREVEPGAGNDHGRS